MKDAKSGRDSENDQSEQKELNQNEVTDNLLLMVVFLRINKIAVA